MKKRDSKTYKGKYKCTFIKRFFFYQRVPKLNGDTLLVLYVNHCHLHFFLVLVVYPVLNVIYLILVIYLVLVVYPVLAVNPVHISHTK